MIPYQGSAKLFCSRMGGNLTVVTGSQKAPWLFLGLFGILVSGGLLESKMALGVPGTIQDTPLISQATSASLITRPILRLGSQGEAVVELQAALKLLGYYTGTVDGIYSDATASAVTQFQQAVGLTADGIVGQSTWERLFPAAPPETPETPQTPCNCTTPSNTGDFPILKLGMRGTAVRGLQERLRVKGFLQSTPDGIFGPATQAAVKAAQTQYQLTPDGVVGPETWNQLMQ